MSTCREKKLHCSLEIQYQIVARNTGRTSNKTPLYDYRHSLKRVSTALERRVKLRLPESDLIFSLQTQPNLVVALRKDSGKNGHISQKV